VGLFIRIPRLSMDFPAVLGNRSVLWLGSVDALDFRHRRQGALPPGVKLEIASGSTRGPFSLVFYQCSTEYGAIS